MTEAYFSTPAGHIPGEQVPSQSSNASDSVVFESTMEEIPHRISTPFRTASEIDVDEPLEESDFRVYEGKLPDWNMIIDSFRPQREALHQGIMKQLKELQGLEEWYERSNKEFHSRVAGAHHDVWNELMERQTRLEADKKKYEHEKELMNDIRRMQTEKIKLNVGGTLFVTSFTTLKKDPNSLLANMFRDQRPDADGAYFIDRDSTYFKLVLNYLRDLKIPKSVREDPRVMDELMQEAQYYRIHGLLKLRWMDLPVITQADLEKRYPRPTSSKSAVVFRLERKNLTGLDFSGYRIDPSSSFHGSNLQDCNFKNAWFIFDFQHEVNFSHTFLKGAAFPKEGTPYRSPGVQFNLNGAVIDNASL
ncbi:predicted protein [Lichtheimia corymbifera JMRC:FSU:9682]|uniref:BTB domain-containing protein n=1 Tax=Lichtheimia corymbifera JMRC:FSU:9682 TaxID=1263082 RepID=A0A068S476_9FUNG|nr:predicted protein [Lichtheimia corymbifera JMRC:FSU:9682]